MLPPVASGQIHFTAALNGAQEVPPFSTIATGTGSFELNGDLTELRYYVSYQYFAGQNAGIFSGDSGANGPIVRSLTSAATASGTFSGVWSSKDAEPLTAAAVDSLLAGKLYLEINAGTNGGNHGIRGQIELSTSLHFEADVDGSRENPPVPTPAGGTGVFVLDRTRTHLDYRVTYRGLTGVLKSGGEIRTGAAGTTGPVVRSVAPAGYPLSATITGSWTSSDVQPLTGPLVDSLISGRLYASFPTQAYPEGEIRGQILLKGGIGFVASLDSAQEYPVTAAHASGTGSFVMNDTWDQVTYSLTYTGLSGAIAGGAHVHLGIPGKTGSVVRTLMLDGGTPEGTISGTWKAIDVTESFTPSLAESLITGKLYADIHTSSNSGGEIRGQINLTTGVGFTSQLSASQNVPPTVKSNGTGTASVILTPDRQTIEFNLTYLNLTDNIAQAGGHFHTGARGTNGGLVRNIVPGGAPGDYSVAGMWSTADTGAQPLTGSIVDSLVAGHIYINLHSGAYIGGEIRGQVSPDFDVLTSVDEPAAGAPARFRLEQNYPNPFNPTTTIRFQLGRASLVDLTIYDALGQKLMTLIHGVRPAGSYALEFTSGRAASGVYFCKLEAGNSSQMTKMLLLK
jgi:hypothetical protein